jgi:hypothetical protein
MVHSRAPLTSTPEAESRCLEQDLRRPRETLRSLEILDRSQPIGLFLVAVIHFLASQEEARSIVATLLEVLPSGSHLLMSCATTEFLDPGTHGSLGRIPAQWPVGRPSPHAAELEKSFTGLELIHPGIVVVSEWRPDPETDEHPQPAGSLDLRSGGPKAVAATAR